jgi:hypothetical protein
LCQKAVWMDRGRVVLAGACARVLEAYASQSLPVAAGTSP